MIAQLLLLFVFGICLAACTKIRVVRMVISIAIATLIGLEISSILLGNALIDFKYYTHVNFNVATQVGGFFLAQNLYSIGSFFLSSFLIYKGAVLLRKWTRHNYWLYIGGIILNSILMLQPQGLFKNLYSIGQLHMASTKDFSQARTALNYDNYTPKNQIRAKPGKNIIAIFMESVEVGYLQDNLAHLTPNLRKLKEDMTYYPMTQNEGGDYTIGAIYTYFTGLPMFFKNHGNQVFDRTANFKISTITNALEEAGYNQLYMAGHPEFAGANIMMEMMGVRVKSEKNYDPKYFISHWGLHDKDLFDLAHLELDTLLEKKEPFALYLSTISTHAIDGVFDKRVSKHFSNHKTQLELMVASLDKQIQELIDRLAREGALENTAIYILPDHLLMGSTSRVLGDFDDPRGLFMITNTESKRYSNNQNINQIDIPYLLLEGAEVDHNLTFLTEQINGDNAQFLKDNRVKILQFNESARLDKPLEASNSFSAPKIEFDDNKVQLISYSWEGENEGKSSIIVAGKQQFDAKRGINLLRHIDGEFRIEHYDTWAKMDNCRTLASRVKELTDNKAQFWLIAHDSVGDSLAYASDDLSASGFGHLAQIKGRRAYLAYSNNGYTSQKSRIQTVKENFTIDQGLDRSQDVMDMEAQDPSKFIAHAGGIIDGHIYTNCKEALDLSYEKGFRYFEIDFIKTKDNKYVAAHDWNQWQERNKYAGSTPVTYETFMNTPILGTYSPLDMKGINEWFANHKDAILVTDKVNEPKEFAHRFIDKSRLIMELFSFEAIIEAQSLGIKDVLLSESIWDQLGPDKLKGLKAKNITAMAISIRTINAQRKMFENLKAEGIKVYAFHIGTDGLKDESYMVRSGLHFCEGLYADHWQFK